VCSKHAPRTALPTAQHCNAHTHTTPPLSSRTGCHTAATAAHTQAFPLLFPPGWMNPPPPPPPLFTTYTPAFSQMTRANTNGRVHMKRGLQTQQGNRWQYRGRKDMDATLPREQTAAYGIALGDLEQARRQAGGRQAVARRMERQKTISDGIMPIRRQWTANALPCAPLHTLRRLVTLLRFCCAFAGLPAPLLQRSPRAAHTTAHALFYMLFLLRLPLAAPRFIAYCLLPTVL